MWIKAMKTSDLNDKRVVRAAEPGPDQTSSDWRRGGPAVGPFTNEHLRARSAWRAPEAIAVKKRPSVNAEVEQFLHVLASIVQRLTAPQPRPQDAIGGAQCG